MSIFLVVMLTKLFVLVIDLVSQLLFIEVKMLLRNLLKKYFKSVSIVKKNKERSIQQKFSYD